MRIGIDARKIADFGIGTYIRGLLGGLAECRGDEQYIVFAPAAARAQIPGGFEHVPLDVPHYSIRELFVVGRAAHRARLDVIHAPHYVVPVTRCPVVVTIHDLIHLHQRHRNPLAPLYARTMLRRSVRKSARILTVSQAVKNDIMATFGIPPSKITVTPNGIGAIFRAAEPDPHPGRYFLYAGNDKPHKNVDRLVEAFGAVHERRGDVTLVLAGAPFERHQARHGVVTPGFVEESELAALYRRSLAVVVPSLEEGFGLPAAEAMASGTAVITSNDAALMEITGDAALHADGRSSAELASAMLRIADDEALRMSMARRGMERARAFTWRRCADLTRRVLLGS